jgi:hypothetical protein
MPAKWLASTNVFAMPVQMTFFHVWKIKIFNCIPYMKLCQSACIDIDILLTNANNQRDLPHCGKRWCSHTKDRKQLVVSRARNDLNHEHCTFEGSVWSFRVAC